MHCLRLLTCLAVFLAVARGATATDLLDLSGHRLEFVGEAGVMWTPTMDIHGYAQSNATRGWDTLAPALRAEAWLRREGALDLGLVLQPIVLSYADTIASPLTYRGRNFQAGEPGKLEYLYNSVRLTANYPLLGDDATGLRAGVSLLARQVELRLSSPSARFTRTDFVAAPLLNLAGSLRLDDRFALVGTADIFPAARNAGFYDLFAGLRVALEGGRAVELGARAFFGGYLPEKQDDFANRVWFQSVVARFIF